MRDQKTDDNVGGGGNMTFKTTSKSPKTTGSPTWRDWSDTSTDDNNGFHGRIKSVTRRKG